MRSTYVRLIGALTAAAAVVLVSPTAAQAAPVDPPAGPVGSTAAPEQAWLAQVAPCNRYVNPGHPQASDAGAGLATAPWITLHAAMAKLQPGQTGCVAAGTYPETGLAPAHSGTATQPIALRAQGTVVIAAPGDGTTFDFQTASGTLGYWLVDGFTMDKQTRDGPAVQLLAVRPGHVRAVAIRNNVIRNGKTASAVLVRGRSTDVTIEGNEITGFRRWVNATRTVVRYDEAADLQRWDANAISIESAPSSDTAQPSVERVRIIRNSLHDNGGDGVQCQGGEGYGLSGELAFDPADIDIADNRVVNTAGSASVEENAYDIKSCQRVSIRGSDAGAQYNKIAELLPTRAAKDWQNTNTANGDAIVVHFAARSVLIENIRLWNVCTGVSIGRGDARARDIVIRRLLLFGVRYGQTPPGGSNDDAKRCTGRGIVVTDTAGVDIYHSTIAGAVSQGIMLTTVSPSRPATDIDVWNTIVTLRPALAGELPTGTTAPRGYWIYLGLDVDLATTGSDYNLFWHPDAAATGQHFLRGYRTTGGAATTEAIDLATWRVRTGYDLDRAAPLGSERGDPLFVADPVTNDFYTQPGSPARDAALANVPGAPTCGARPDAGFLESCT
jgi:hypothetical protein